jgi:hypothetical protein
VHAARRELQARHRLFRGDAPALQLVRHVGHPPLHLLFDGLPYPGVVQELRDVAVGEALLQVVDAVLGGHEELLIVLWVRPPLYCIIIGAARAQGVAFGRGRRQGVVQRSMWAEELAHSRQVAFDETGS